MIFYKKYPKLFFFVLIIVASVMIFYETQSNPPIHNFLISLDYLGVLLSGFFYAYGFTAPIGTVALLVLAKEYNLFIAGLIGGIGALISDMIIFFFIRQLFTDEITLLKNEKIIIRIGIFTKKIFGSFNSYLLTVFAGFLICTPLPTEIGIALMASQNRMTIKSFALIAFGLHTIGIFLILLLGNLI